MNSSMDNSGVDDSPRTGDHYQPGRNGLAFRDGKLYSFSPERVVVLRGGDEPATWAKVAEGKGRSGWFSSRVLANEIFAPVLDRYVKRAADLPVAMDGEYPVLKSGQKLFPFCRQFFAKNIF